MKVKKFLIIGLACFLLFQCGSQRKNKVVENWTYPYPVKHLRIADTLNIAYVEVGQGPQTLVFIHGLGSNLKAWRKNIEGLKTEYRCIALDLPGYGKSSKGQYEFGMEFFSNIVNEFVDGLGLKSPILVGHSMGGQIALHAAHKQPDKYAKMVLLAPAGFETFSEQERNWFANFYTQEVVAAASDEQIVKNFELNFYDMPEDARFMVDDRMEMKADSAAYADYCKMIPQCVLGMLDEPVFDWLPEVKTPSLVIYGEEDALIPNRILHPSLNTKTVAEQGSEALADARLKMVAAGGHFVNWEQSMVVNELIRSFVEGG